MQFIRELMERRYLKRQGISTRCARQHLGVTSIKRDKEVIISLTSHPLRINSVHKTLITLLCQTKKPDRLILWLAREQFPEGVKSLPRNITNLQRNGLEIKWYKDIKSYKKLIPAMQMYPDAIIVTVDDDWYYKREMLEVLLEEHNQHPKDIICHMITHPYLDEHGRIRSNVDNTDYRGQASFFNKILGGSGALYPPYSLYKDVLSEEIFMRVAPTNDDIWFWAMAVRNGTKVRVPVNAFDLLAMTDAESQNASALAIVNESNDLYTKSVHAILGLYPDIVKILKEEQEND